MIADIVNGSLSFLGPVAIAVLAIKLVHRRRRRKQHERRKWGSRPLDLQKRTLPDLRL